VRTTGEDRSRCSQSQGTFNVTRAGAGGQVMVPIVVTDGCGPWTTLVANGPQGF